MTSASPRALRPLLVGVLAALSLAADVGCGARSGFSDDGGDTFSDGGDDDTREGSCAMPIELPFAPITVRGRLLGGGSARGWCGEDNGGDRGREDTYVLTPPYSTDVILTLGEGTDFPALLRVTPDACVAEADVLPEICIAPEIGDARHFWAEGGREYYISVDSPAGTDGRYELDVAFGWPPLEACAVHPNTINQEPGGYFLWENELGGGQGRVDGPCGGPGTENMFRLQINEPTYMSVFVTTEIDAVISVRSSCAAASELTCTNGGNETGFAGLDYFFADPGEYYLVVDQADISGGYYLLEVYFG
ncbi:MAG: hypothetical protein KC486_20955 [Myxococcales bacterium]|nr:hypothetical protein [Myxococcales bacterium]